jgi:hypothetical protein
MVRCARLLRLLPLSANFKGLALPSQNRFIRQLLENYLPTAIGTLIEPFWTVLNRHLCMLEPFDSLRKGRKRAKDSLGLDYSSLPPQFAIWKALRQKHFLLATVCGMALLANVLAVALSGLFFESTVQNQVRQSFTLPYSLHFNALNGSAPPFIQDRSGNLEPYYITNSNLTAHTPMPPWTDDKFFYLPFVPDVKEKNDTWTYRAVTPMVGGQLSCRAIDVASSLSVFGIRPDETGTPSIASSANLSIVIERSNGVKVNCGPRFIGFDQLNFNINGSASGQSAFEFNTGLDGLVNVTSNADRTFCREHVAAGWIRAFAVSTPDPKFPTTDPAFNVSSVQGTAIVCHAEVVSGFADVLVSSDGHVKKQISHNISSKSVESLFSTSSSDLIGQAHEFLVADRGLAWHKDSFPSDFNNYLIGLTTNMSEFLDPNRPPPSAQDMIPPFAALYSKMFSVLLGRNSNQLLEVAKDQSIMGFVVQPEVRIFMSKTMFAIAEAILGLYIITTIILYVRRPWRVLARMPDTPASMIAFFAASHTVKDLRNTGQLSSNERAKLLEKLDDRYGFGTFMGSDGKAHVGIEKHPFLATLTREGSEISLGSGTKGRGAGLTHGRWWKLIHWKSAKVREGGWI